MLISTPPRCIVTNIQYNKNNKKVCKMNIDGTPPEPMTDYDKLDSITDKLEADNGQLSDWETTVITTVKASLRVEGYTHKHDEFITTLAYYISQNLHIDEFISVQPSPAQTVVIYSMLNGDIQQHAVDIQSHMFDTTVTEDLLELIVEGLSSKNTKEQETATDTIIVLAKKLASEMNMELLQKLMDVDIEDQLVKGDVEQVIMRNAFSDNFGGGSADWIIMHPDSVITLAGELDKGNKFFDGKPYEHLQEDTVFQYAGTLNDTIKVYHGQFLPPGEAIIGKLSKLQSGLVFCPYVSLMMSHLAVDVDSFVQHCKFISRHAYTNTQLKSFTRIKI